MKPMFEELEREDALALFNYTINLPEIPRAESIKHLLRAFRVPNMERFIGGAAQFDAQRAAMTENQLMLFTTLSGAPTPVQPHPQDDHQAHMPIHQQFQQSEGFQRLNNIQKQQAITLFQQHLEGHQQLMQAEMQQAGPQGGGGIRPMADQARSGSDVVESGLNKIDSAVRSSAQEISQPGAVINRDQN